MRLNHVMKKIKVMSLLKYITLIFIFLTIPILKCSICKSRESINKEEISAEIQKIYNFRCDALKTGDYSTLNNYYDTSRPSGKYALEHEVKRAKYLKDWCSKRNIEFKDIKSTINLRKAIPHGSTVRLVIAESYKFDYKYKNDEASPLNSFGVGIRHTASVVKKDGKWLVLSDWYTDCFEDSLQLYTAALNNNISSSRKYSNNFSGKRRMVYDRKNAVAYADKYCGIAWGNSNNFKYNRKYDDYNGAGGDCTNFISQVLGDKEGGAMRTNGEWHPGTRAWSNADGLKNYLLRSGRGSVIKIGTFDQLTANISNTSNGVFSKLKIGDLIAYEKGRGNIDHFAIVTGFDSHNYPLVNSHTTDRYHVPWDLGWGNKNIRFFLIHMRN
ncbi:MULTISPECIES: amidase domain-containing protein [Clostridium]|uniref:Amidase domain protein n=2 Tax=Clostridium TaxID=1485 RepID=D8GIF2_CLOLD|nr:MULTISPECIES: amidase domain-containing protein [Clostridium]ADK17026.1 conserved hypothetical protein [Clostridium ljungdahlii DSM 13528]OAA85207.1 putative amidase domain protein [Clostridium ljungdahlii DSM 13528]